MRSFNYDEPRSVRVRLTVVLQLSPGLSHSLQKRPEVWFPTKRYHDWHIVHCELYWYTDLFNLDLTGSNHRAIKLGIRSAKHDPSAAPRRTPAHLLAGFGGPQV